VPDRDGVPVLTYHSLDDSGSPISTPPAVFREQMNVLRARGYRGLSLSELLDGWEKGASLPARPLVLCFDDGFANLLDHGVPLLRELGFGASIFAVVDYCGGNNDWPSQPARIPRLPLLSLANLRDLVSGGFEVGCHSSTHPRLLRTADEDAELEIVASKHRLEDGLGRPVRVFAYPYGQAGVRHRALARKHYRAACGVALGTARATDDRHHLPRIDMYYYRHPAVFRLFGTALAEPYLGLRAAVLRLRALLSQSGGM
jgi:peptidoglycan/xylan/chitin deacetylase (PgdA/CDA1 family)